MQRMSKFFDHAYGKVEEVLTETKTMLDNKRASRSAFSVALNNSPRPVCFGPFSADQVIMYTHIFINLGSGYSLQNGIFTVPRSGVYSLSVTIYTPFGNPHACGNLMVNEKLVSVIPEQNGQDAEDSATIVTTMQLLANDRVFVILPRGCAVCDDTKHHNTFTGFLLYATK
ncbi:Caprin-2 RNA granule protein 140 [Collichthys lucidus]|uniref:Caprin-2 RNA granule protein 140 n=1 Tax=Collichthys lucidus TaxID=240159 RepID=A0A4U5V2L3_COLLU|nr:Caprin-2 RNA granule protein 140 [Collichthys lucidus]TKS81380.1 Caprin-2 RNA granule protein 140 [Collichthys lucidus]